MSSGSGRTRYQIDSAMMATTTHATIIDGARTEIGFLTDAVFVCGSPSLRASRGVSIRSSPVTSNAPPVRSHHRIQASLLLEGPMIAPSRGGGNQRVTSTNELEPPYEKCHGSHPGLFSTFVARSVRAGFPADEVRAGH